MHGTSRLLDRRQQLKGMALALSVAVLVLGPPSPSRAQDPMSWDWRKAFDFMVENVCTDGSNRPIQGASPLDGPVACPRQRKLGIGERLPYHKRDWSGLADRAANPDGYQQSDSYPVRSTLGPAVVQTYDFGGGSRAFGQFDDGDGGQVGFVSASALSFGVTEDGGAGLQLFLGPGCAPDDGWIVVDRSFGANPGGHVLAHLTRYARRCPKRLDAAFTRWNVQPVSYRTRSHDGTGHTEIGRMELTTLVSEHFGGESVAAADHLERMYFTRELGYTRWERWQNLSMHDRPQDRQQAAALAASDRCEPGLGSPSAGSGWVMIDCREWTNMVRPVDPTGDLPVFWLDRLRADASTRSLFAD